ncbi:hypothetical protein NKG05_02755 [Oerskovia sp. M15]
MDVAARLTPADLLDGLLAADELLAAREDTLRPIEDFMGGRRPRSTTRPSSSSPRMRRTSHSFRGVRRLRSVTGLLTPCVPRQQDEHAEEGL